MSERKRFKVDNGMIFDQFDKKHLSINQVKNLLNKQLESHTKIFLENNEVRVENNRLRRENEQLRQKIGNVSDMLDEVDYFSDNAITHDCAIKDAVQILRGVGDE